MKFFSIYFLLIISIIPLSGCKKLTKSSSDIFNKSFIIDFQLIQENPNTKTSIKITSPKAIIDTTNNNLEIFEGTIELMTMDSQDFKITSGNATLNNLTNSIRVFNGVNISFPDKLDYYITTNAFSWDLHNSIIDIKNPIKINFNNTNISANSGSYNIDSGLLKIEYSDFNRSILNSEGSEDYHINIKSDFANWLKKDNTLLFTSNEKQVETTINFLITK